LTPASRWRSWRARGCLRPREPGQHIDISGPRTPGDTRQDVSGHQAVFI
jgi:hypothetical protein